MAAISITAANVATSTGAVTKTGIWGETVTAGQAVYLKAADGRWWLAKADAASTDEVAGIALSGGAAGQPGAIQTRGIITIGATVVVGTVYLLSAVAGGAIVPEIDITTGGYVTMLGTALTAGTIELNIVTTGITHA